MFVAALACETFGTWLLAAGLLATCGLRVWVPTSAFRWQCMFHAFVAGSEAISECGRAQRSMPGALRADSLGAVGVGALAAWLRSPAEGPGPVVGTVFASLAGGGAAVVVLLLRFRQLDVKPFVAEHPDGTVSVRKAFYLYGSRRARAS